ncbi:ATP-binding protein [Enemella evansiae]|nr:ATP-binding protein [Enemella evansiae]
MPARTRNPFQPSFGVSPPLLSGRDEILDSFGEGLDHGPGAPARAILLEGQRGTGKTVLLNELEATAAEAGWLVISDEAGAGFLERLTQTHLPALLEEWDPRGPRRRLLGGGLGSVGQISTQVSERHQPQPTMRTQLALLTDIVAENNRDADVPVGVLITLDEIHAGSLDELDEFGGQYQLLRREGRELAFAAAGITTDIDTLIRSKRVTFLQRAQRHQLTNLTPSEAAEALQVPIAEAGGAITPDALEHAVTASEGYPYVIQAIGYRAWHLARGATIEHSHVAGGVTWAGERLGDQVHEPALRGTTPREKQFLCAMAVDDGPAASASIRQRLGLSASHVSNLGQSLQEKGLVTKLERGRFDYLLPRLREHLRTQYRDETTAMAGRGAAAQAFGELPRTPPPPPVAPDPHQPTPPRQRARTNEPRRGRR